jgi:hypothetical protein
VVRLGLIQWQMRSLTNLDALLTKPLLTPFLATEVILHYFLNFTAPLMADFNHLSEAEAIRELAKHTEAVKLKFQEFAISYNINIITEHAFIENEHVYNVGFFANVTVLMKCIVKFILHQTKFFIGELQARHYPDF